MRTFLFTALFSLIAAGVFAGETTKASDKNLMPELSAQSGAVEGAIRNKNNFTLLTDRQNSPKNTLTATLERLRKTGEDLGQLSKDIEEGYNADGEVDGLLLETARKKLSRFQLDIEETGDATGDSGLVDSGHLMKKKKALSERTIETQANFSKIALALAGMGNETVQQSIGEYHKSLKAALKAEESLRRSFQNLSKSNQK